MTWVLVFTVGFAVLLADAGNWSQFRGPQSNQLPEDAKYPIEWADDKNVQWKVEIPGKGWASPIVWGDKVFIATSVSDEETDKGEGGASSALVYRFELYCLEKSTGKQLWKRVAFKGTPLIPKHSGNTYASETPVTDGERVYVYFGMIGVYCYDLAGNPVWKKDLGAYPMDGNWGTGSSPVLHGDHLYLQIDSEEEAFLVALDTKTGDQRWRISREEEKSNWSSPVIWKNTLRTELITGGKKVRAYDPHTGALLWELGMGGGRSCPSPVADEHHIYVGNEARGDGGGFLFAVKAGAEGDITPKEGESTSAGVVWMQPKSGLSMASPLLYQGEIYVFGRKRPIVNCYDALTGEPNYSKRIEGATKFWTSPWAYDDKVFGLDETGTTYVLSAGSEFEVLAQNSIDDVFWASVAASDGALILRGVNYVYCIRQ